MLLEDDDLQLPSLESINHDCECTGQNVCKRKELASSGSGAAPTGCQ